MSICIYAFLGTNIENIEERVFQNFETLGFCVQFHPDMTLLESPAGGIIYVRINKIPPHLKRVSMDGTPLLVGFEYEVTKREKKVALKNDWLPKGVKQYTGVISTRTASGRSRAAYYMQALTVAILAKETGGYFYIDVEDRALTGIEGIQRIFNELNTPTELEFDADAFPFESWPPISLNQPFVWPLPIKSVFVEQYIASIKTPKRRLKLSLTGILSWLFILFFLVVGLLYS